MILSAAAILLIVFCFPWFFEARGASNFSPAKLASILGIITNIPYMLVLANNATISSVYSYIGQRSFDGWIFWYGVLQSLAFISYLLGVYIKFPHFMRGLLSIFDVKVRETDTKKLVITLSIIGVIAWYLRVQHAGGIVFLLKNIADRSALLAGSGIYALIMDTSFFLAIIVYIYDCKFKVSAARKVGMVVMFFSFGAMLSVFGGRKTTLYLLLFSIMAWTFCVGPIKRPARLAIPVLIFIPIYFVGSLLVRDKSMGDGFIRNPMFLISWLVENVSDVVANLSYIDTYVFILKYFSINNFWYGAGFADLASLLMPSLFPNGRPPIDDGVYVRSLFDGYSVFPPVAFDVMYPSSWPPESFGGGFMNFGVIGIFLFIFVKGLLARQAYMTLRKSGNSPICIYLYGFFVLNFHLTNLRIVQCASALVATLFVVAIIKIRFK